MVKKEVEMFDVRRAEEFKAGVVSYLEAMLRAQVCQYFSVTPSAVSMPQKRNCELRALLPLNSFEKLVDSHFLSLQEDVAGTWERYLPEIQQINHKH